MKNLPVAIVVGLLLLLLLVLFSTTFTVKYNEVAIRATFGQADAESVIRDPGLHWRLPVFIDKVTKLDTRLQLVEPPLEELTTDDGLQVVARAFLLWRIDTEAASGPIDFYKRYTSIENANDLLRGQFRTAFTGVLGRYAFDDLLGEESRLAEAEEEIQSLLAAQLAEDGVEAITVGISQFVLPAKTSSAVLSRMEATRKVLSNSERDAGEARANKIRSEGNTAADKIGAFANARAEEIRQEGQADAKRFLDEMKIDEDLAIFLTWLDTLKQTLNQNTTVIIPANSQAPYHLLSPDTARFEGAIPMPAESDEQGG